MSKVKKKIDALLKRVRKLNEKIKKLRASSAKKKKKSKKAKPSKKKRVVKARVIERPVVDSAPANPNIT